LGHGLEPRIIVGLRPNAKSLVCIGTWTRQDCLSYWNSL
jgi:hypothetical protein